MHIISGFTGNVCRHSYWSSPAELLWTEAEEIVL